MNSCKFCGSTTNLFKISNEKDDVFYYMCDGCFLNIRKCYNCDSSKFYNNLKCVDCNVKNCSSYETFKNRFNTLLKYLVENEILTNDIFEQFFIDV